MDLARRRRRRRRRQDRPPISAHLVLDERMKEDIGIVSEDLYADLFPASRTGKEDTDANPIRHVAISPWVPASLASTRNSAWTILAVKIAPKQDSSSQPPRTSVRLPASSVALQPFLHTLQVISPGKALLRRDTPIEIRVVDVVPVGLDTVFVTLNTDALIKLHESHLKFGGGFVTQQSRSDTSLRHKALNGLTGSNGKAKAKIDEKALEATWRQAVREALKSPRLVHAGDQIPLPLQGHPISHTPAPPAKITACEPLSQGLVLPSSRIVILHSHDRARPNKQASSLIVDGILEEDEDTSNEQFYSAAEERSSPMQASEDQSTTDFSDSQSIATDQDDLSDDSEETISLSTPMLPLQSSGILSAYSAATPRAGGAFHSVNIGTPGSMRSGFSTSTVREGAGKGKLFKPQGLLQKLPDDLLHPKPAAEDDEEARIFVDTSALVKIGCFSGDWVRIESATEPTLGGLGLVPWTMGTFNDDQEEKNDGRPVKVFGLPESMFKKSTRMPTHKIATRKTSFLDLISPGAPPTVYMPPMLLANLSNPAHLRITPLSAQPQGPNRSSAQTQNGRITSSSMPPLASEVKLLKILTPLSHDIQLQPILFAELKNYFEGKRRILKTGDLVAISFDESLGRSVYQAGDDASNEDLLSKSKRNRWRSNSDAQDSGSTAVAWFKVGTVISETAKDDETDDPWGGVAFVDASVDATKTKLTQSANEPARLPPTLKSTWQYYQGVKRLPASTGLRPAKALGTVELPEPYISSMRRRLRGLISASASPQAIHMGLPPLAILLTSTQRQVGKATTAERACEDLGLHSCVIDAFDAFTDGGAGSSEQTEVFVRKRAERALACGAANTVLLFRHIDALSGDRMLSAFKDILADSRVVIATSTDVDKIPEGIRGLFTHELELGAPDEVEREGILHDIVDGAGVRVAPDVELSSVALKTAALVAGDLVDVVNRAVVARKSRLEGLAEAANNATQPDIMVTIRDIEIAGGSSALSLTKPDFDAAVDAARKNFADAIGAPKIPNVSWDDVGGLTHVKDAVMETIQLPLARPELFAKGMKKRSGILFYGPPGTGKTLLAKAIATEFSLNFFSVKGPELLNMYIGESEANVRRVFQRARDARPCVVFFDELDSVAPKRGNQGDSGGVMDRIVSQLLAELDGMSNGEEGGGGVFVIGATNRPDLLDQALLRPGRFDKMLYLGVSDTHDKQKTILEALTRKFTLHPSCSLQRISSTLPFTYTGADLYALCSDAMLQAITRQALKIDQKVAAHNAALAPGQQQITIAHFFDHFANEDDISVTVTEEDFQSAHRDLVPSVSAEELGHYEKVRKTFEGSGTPSSKQANQQPPPSQQQIRPASQHSAGRPPTIRRTSSSNGSRNGQRGDKSTFYFDPAAVSGDDDEYIIRTDHLSSNGLFNGRASGKGNGNGNGNIFGGGKSRGKGKGAFGSATDGDEELYE